MSRSHHRRPELIVVGCSAGGLKALQILVSGLHLADLPPVVVCCHTASPNVTILCELLARHAHVPVQEACERHPLLAQHIYVAPSGYHLLIEEDHHFALSMDPKVNYSRPSIDVLFETAAASYPASTLGVILTGANSDGAAGLKRIGETGGITLVQNPVTAEVPYMPTAALAMAAPDYVMELDLMAPLICQLCQA